MSSARVAGLTVGQVMHPGIVSCAADTAAAEVARMMVARSVHCVAVVDPTHPAGDGSGTPRVWGIVSDLDVVSALTRPGPAASAADLASDPVISVRPAASLHEAAEAMVRHGAHHVVVADPDRHTPVGVLSTLDIAAALAREAPPARSSDRTADIRTMLRDSSSRNP